MKLLKLTLSAFGPYKGEEIIDFSLIHDRRLFLITGPTGAGKTTIFDGICYALFGKASGASRDGDMLRSDFADTTNETKVELEFMIRDNLYKISRSPSQVKPKVRGEGTTKKDAEASLVINDGEMIVGIKDVDKKIVEILGINAEQFRQIVMLPQGEFRKLLEAESKDREEILRRIFKTNIYYTVQERLKEQAGTLKNQIQESISILNSQINNIITDSDTDLGKLILAEDKDHDAIIRLLKELNETDSKAYLDLKNRITMQEKLVLALTAEVNQGKLINEKFDKKAKLEATLEDLNNQQPKMKALEELIKKMQKAQQLREMENSINELIDTIARNKTSKSTTEAMKNELKDKQNQYNQELNIRAKELETINIDNENLGRLKDKLKKFEALTEKIANLNQKEHEWSDLKDEVAVKKQELKENEDNLTKLNQELTEYKNVDEELSGTTIIQNNLQNELNQLLNQKTILEDIINNENEYKEKLETYNSSKIKATKAKKNYDDRYLLFLNGQAGVMAQKLQDKEPCPVCGSTNHPKKAVLLDNVPREEELRVLKAEWEEAAGKESNSFLELEKVSGILAEQRAQYRKLRRETPENFNSTQELDNINCLIKANTEKRDDCHQKLDKLNEGLEKRNQLLELKDKLEYDLKETKAALEKLKEDYNKLDKEYHTLRAQVDIEKEELGEYTDKEKLIQDINLLENKIKKIQSDYNDISDKLNKCNQELVKQETQLATLIQQISDNEKDLANKRNTFNKKLSEFGFVDITDYNKTKEKDSELASLEEDLKKYRENYSHVTKTLEDLNEELTDVTPIDVDALSVKLAEEKQNLSEFQDSANALNANLQNNERIEKKLAKIYKQIKKDKEEYELISLIAKTANGDNKKRISFERYVLAAYFDSIIMAANERLTKMTHNRYYLLRKEEKDKGRQQQGLDLEVIDSYTGKARLVNTLSGGESFIAALAMALGLADVIQSFSGGIELDTIFIDEGFGSLDPESLDQAINTLLMVQSEGRLVGIISHVQELKDRIDVKLEVIPSKSGSRTNLIY